jgi:protein-arginine kinase activator protein McsA
MEICYLCGKNEAVIVMRHKDNNKAIHVCERCYWKHWGGRCENK